MKQLLFLIIGLFVLGIPSKADAQCATPTCITGEMIAIADHAEVAYDPSLTHYEFLFVERGPYQEPTLTNVTVYRQEAPDKVGITVDYPGAFCTMEGHAYGRLFLEVELPEEPEYTTVYDREPRLDAAGEPVLDEEGDPIFDEIPRQVQTNEGATYTELVASQGCEP